MSELRSEARRRERNPGRRWLAAQGRMFDALELVYAAAYQPITDRITA